MCSPPSSPHRRRPRPCSASPPLPCPPLTSHDPSNDGGCENDWARQRPSPVSDDRHRHNAEPAAPAPTPSLSAILRFSWLLMVVEAGRAAAEAGRARAALPPIRLAHIGVTRSSSVPSSATKACGSGSRQGAPTSLPPGRQALLPFPTGTPSVPPEVPPSAPATRLLADERDGGAVPRGSSSPRLSSAFSLLPDRRYIRSRAMICQTIVVWRAGPAAANLTGLKKFWKL